MQYMGSKNQIAKHLKPIIESYLTEDIEYYIEPFVGGANMIDKINFYNRVGSDNNEYLIGLLEYAQNTSNELPQSITKEEYYSVKENLDNYPKWYVGLVGFCASYGAKWFGGYAKSPDVEKAKPRNRVAEAIRNLDKQRNKLQGIQFIHKSFNEYIDVKNSVIYCDIPYKGATQYKDKFPYDEFYNWCKSMKEQGNIVLVSEYNMPDDFDCIWEKEHKTCMDKNHTPRIERLYIMK